MLQQCCSYNDIRRLVALDLDFRCALRSFTVPTAPAFRATAIATMAVLSGGVSEKSGTGTGGYRQFKNEGTQTESTSHWHHTPHGQEQELRGL